MPKKRFSLGMLVLVLVFGLTLVGCGGGDDTTSGGGNTITITGITGRTGEEAELELHSGNDWVAEGFGRVSNNSVIFSLVQYDNPDTGSGPYLFTGSGSYFLQLNFWTDWSDDSFVYTNGQTWAALGITSAVGITAKVPKYTISSARSSIAFSQFTRVPDNW
jgi:hypothetical protein